KKLHKKHAVIIKQDVSRAKHRYINAILLIDNVHAEYEHNTTTDDYYVTVALQAMLYTANDSLQFKKQYATDAKLHFGSEWAEWVGVNKVTSYALNKTFDKALEDPAFNNALKSLDIISSMQGTTVLDETEPAHDTTPEIKGTTSRPLEDRLRQLKKLHDQGLITDDEYRTKRKSLLDEL
ncbi:MAG: hypothetical protein GF384_08760, partial [Elusimicrobia bacterium]|nr:hypothetical protein [Elusimicrobiota bacterium]MBD3412698.1 hypothetical protein [Elusimicrobiota bacterium]